MQRLIVPLLALALLGATLAAACGSRGPLVPPPGPPAPADAGDDGHAGG